ncbi:MAG: T9SS type A sorting domain-containing protein [Bacteroidetes bacterium]|nr:MAG: T9SS type A sorting domain-containing protein [Bacteroidota bacterium]
MNPNFTQIKKQCSKLFILLCLVFSFSNSYAQCPVDVIISLDGGGNTIAVAGGATINVTGTYSVANDNSCPSCIQQLIIGIDSVASSCIYDNIPGVCPSPSTGSINTTLTAPLSQGIYTIWVNNPYNFSCTLGDYSGPTGNGALAIGTIYVDCPPQVSISLNGGGNSITVAPNASVTMTGTYVLSNPTGCPSCIQQLIVGIDTVALDCIYDNIPDVCPSSSNGTLNVAFTAPAAEGTYTLYSNNPFNFSCTLTDYTGATGNAAQIIGTLTVACLPEINASLNGVNDTLVVSPGTVVSLDGNFSISNPSSCPSCIQQLIVGLDTVATACIYDNIPDVCPNASVGTFSEQITAPMDPGTYPIYVNNPFNFSCTLSDYTGASGNGAMVIAVLIVECLPEVNITLNGGGNTITVAPGTVITVGGDYTLSNPQSCPSCIQQLIIGVDTVPADCVYDGIPDVCPSQTIGTIASTITAPVDTGVYTIYANNPFNFSCTLTDYTGMNGNNATAIGTITVSSTIGIASVEGQSSMKIYPNPNSNRFILEFESNASSQAGIEISDYLGQVVYQEEFATAAGKIQKSVNTGNLDNGIYFVRLVTKEADNVIKLLIVK